MTKTKKKIHKVSLAAGLSILLGTGVIITGAHLSDVVAHAFNLVPPSITLGVDTSKKVTGDLHNHIEKQTMKSIVKVVGDDLARTDRRHVKHKGHSKKKGV
jgi:hypothetical protein